MQPETPTSKPRRGRHFGRWILLGILATFGWYGWKAYDVHLAKQEAKALGWKFESYDPVATIWKNWRAAFRLKTWNVPKLKLYLSEEPRFDDHSALLHRLNPDYIAIRFTVSLKDLSALQGLTNLSTLGVADCPKLTNIDAIKSMKGLKTVFITGIPHLTNIDAVKELKNLRELNLWSCPELTNLDALQGLKSLETLDLSNCTGLRNVDGILGLTQLKTLDVSDCAGLSEATLAALKAALPNTKIRAPQ